MKDLWSLSLLKGTAGGVEACISKSEEALSNLKGEGEIILTIWKNAFLNGVLDPSYALLVDAISDHGTSTHENCILAIRKKSVYVEGN